ncbi:MAG: YkgJ family cysteine cluster protein [Thermoprotei archaeon]|nr:MAG: YkgJ family cysteine cluster protein [Thermoprotei archaeon]RLF20582.1 MAG: YkgJ family cysteine cluster protein [Thermoprotei archaeon]
MPLTKADIERIKMLGFEESFFARLEGGVPRLRNINGHCVFLNPETNECTIYPHRPSGCRLYPLVLDVEKGVVVVDELCPRAKEIPMEVVEELAPRLLKLIEQLCEENT